MNSQINLYIIRLVILICIIAEISFISSAANNAIHIETSNMEVSEMDSETPQRNLMFEDGKMWIVRYEHPYNPDLDYDATYRVEGDTVVLNTMVKKISVTGPEQMYDREIKREWFAYEEDGVIYALWYYDEFVPILNFSVEIGDTPRVDNSLATNDDLQVTDVYWINLRGKNRKVIELSTPFGYNPDAKDYWVEGIGTMNQSLYIPPIESVTDIFYYYYNYMTACYKNDECMFIAEEDLDKVSGLNIPKMDFIGNSHTIYDIYGKHVDFPQKGNIYIQNHRKIIWQ